MTQTTLLLIPVFIQVALTFALLFRLGRARVGAVKQGDVKVKDIALGQKAWPDHITQVSNAYASQFELPVLFYAATLLALATRRVDLLLVGCGWIFCLSRLVHAYVHVTSNHVPSRFNAFLVGLIALMGMWAWLAVRLLLEGV